MAKHKKPSTETVVVIVGVTGLAAAIAISALLDDRSKPAKKPANAKEPATPTLGSASEPWKTKQGWRREREYLRLLGYRIAINDEPMASWTDRMWVALYQKDFNKMVDWGFTGADKLTVDGGYGAKTMGTIWIAKDIQDTEKRLFWNIARDIY